MIKDAVDSINTTIAAGIDYTVNYKGICKLVDIDNRKFPAVWDKGSSNWSAISLDDQYDLQYYHRMLNVSSDDNEQQDFNATKQPTQRTYNMVMTIIFKKNYDEDDLEDLLDLIPFDFTITGSAQVTLELGVVNAIQDEIVESEFGEIPREDHTSNFNIYQLTYSIEEIIC